jgi:flagellar biosynthetic protein FliR
MVAFHLDKFLTGHVFAFVFIFSRVGSAIMLFPGIGEVYVSSRIRLLLALAISFLVMEPMLDRIPEPPEGMPDLVRLIGYEVIAGLFFGTVLRLSTGVLETAGSIIALQTGLSNATILNPTLATQSPLPSAFLSVAGLTLIFMTGLDHMLLRGIMATYNVFPPSGELMPGDLAQVMIRLTNETFVVGVELALPFLIMGLLMQVALGLMQRVMPQVQLFLVILPVQLGGGLALMALTTAGILTIWLRYFDSSVSSFFVR